LASSASAIPTDPSAGASTEPQPRSPAAGAGFQQTRADAAALVAEVPRVAYKAYEPGVIVAQKYQLVRVLGEGGMGSVWVAKNLALDVHVALKLIRAELAHSVPGLGERLLQEARAAASIEHPAVIQIFDFGMTELSDPFIAMELLHGESLASTVKRRGKVNPLRAVQTLLPIVDALLAAHQRGIVHRDLKPDNIFLSRGAGNRLEPKVLDFGIAKFERKATTNLTSIGTVLGSPAYMSPEQARGEGDVDGRTDVWAMCVVLYEVITGRLPFAGDNYNALLFSILDGQPKTFVELGINESLLWSIISRGLEKDRERRCPDMFELGRALALWLLDRGVQEDVCHALLKSKWIERAPHRAATAHHSFFPSDPPDGTEPHTLRSGEEGALPEAEGVESGILVRAGGEVDPAGFFGVETTKQMTAIGPLSRGRYGRVVAAARSRWAMLTVLGALVSFSLAVGWQAFSGPGAHDEDDAHLAALLDEPHRSQIPLATVATAVQMPRPLAVPSASVAVAPPAPIARRAPTPEARPATPAKPARAWEPKVARSDLKNPFR